MKGIVERVEQAGDPGRIRGEDGRVYRFRQSQVRDDGVPAPGHRVDFISLGDEARDIYLLGPGGTPVAPVPDGMSASRAGTDGPRAYVRPSANPAESLWKYFADGLTSKYSRFTGRARRAEYWAYTLFWWLFVAGFFVLDVILLGVTGVGGGAWWFFYLSFLWQLGTLIPNIAVVVRRLHDVNMSGWLYLVKAADFVIPWLGTGIIFIFTLMDSRVEPNAHGPSPKYDQDRDIASVFS